jgi:hypothetical protein
MTEAQVKALLGDPIEDLNAVRGALEVSAAVLWRNKKEARAHRVWQGRGAAISVGFCEGGRLVEKIYIPVQGDEPSFWDKVRRWLSLV